MTAVDAATTRPDVIDRLRALADDPVAMRDEVWRLTGVDEDLINVVATGVCTTLHAVLDDAASSPSTIESADTGPDFIRSLLSAWECCATCAGGVLLRHDRAVRAEALAPIEELVAPQWRSISPSFEDFEGTIEAWTSGRNWMIDRIREALDSPPERAS